MKEMTSEDREFYKNHLRMPTRTSFCLYKSSVPAPLFFGVIAVFTSGSVLFLPSYFFLFEHSLQLTVISLLPEVIF